MNPNFIPLDAVSTLPFDLDSIQIANPCRADWNLMDGDDRTRHCGSCAKNVYNLSALTRAEAARLILEKEGNLCVQLHRRADGTLITSDCTIGISSLKKSGRALQTLVVASIAAVLGFFGVSVARAARQTEAPTLGAPMMGEMAPVMGRMKPLPPKTAPKPTKNHAKRPTRKTATRKSASQYRRHR